MKSILEYIQKKHIKETIKFTEPNGVIKEFYKSNNDAKNQILQHFDSLIYLPKDANSVDEIIGIKKQNVNNSITVYFLQFKTLSIEIFLPQHHHTAVKIDPYSDLNTLFITYNSSSQYDFELGLEKGWEVFFNKYDKGFNYKRGKCYPSIKNLNLQDIQI